MRIRKLLLIHPSRSTRALITKYVYSELTDIEISEAQTGRQALDRMETGEFDIIICTDHPTDMTIAELKTIQQKTVLNGQTPLIVISESESNHVRNKLVAQGFDRVVQIRLRPSDLIRKIDVVCNPRNWRRDERYHIPGMEAAIGMGRQKVEAALINISMGGILVEMATDRPDLLMQDGVDIILKVWTEGGLDGIEGLRAKLLRLEPVRWKPDLTPEGLRAAFAFTEVSSEQRDKLAQLLKMAQADKILANTTDNLNSMP